MRESKLSACLSSNTVSTESKRNRGGKAVCCFVLYDATSTSFAIAAQYQLQGEAHPILQTIHLCSRLSNVGYIKRHDSHLQKQTRSHIHLIKLVTRPGQFTDTPNLASILICCVNIAHCRPYQLKSLYPTRLASVILLFSFLTPWSRMMSFVALLPLACLPCRCLSLRGPRSLQVSLQIVTPRWRGALCRSRSAAASCHAPRKMTPAMPAARAASRTARENT